MPQPSITVIIPAFNVESWIEKAINALREQSFSDYEVIIVNDGSQDGTGAICDRLAAEDERVTVIHQDNAGAAKARNVAMKKARGKYTYFMDADDWSEKTMLEDMFEFAERENLDLVVTGFYIDTYYADDKYFREERPCVNVVFGSKEEFREAAYALFDAQLLYAPWNKLYRTSYLHDNGIYFPETFWDDLPFNLDVIRDIERIGCLDGKYYHFLRARSEAENTRYRPDMLEKRNEENLWLRELFKYWEIDNEEVEEFLCRRHAERLLGCIENVTCKDSKLSLSEKRSEIKRILDDPEAIRAFKGIDPQSRMMERLMKPLRSGNVEMALVQSEFISWVKRNNINLFARLKASR